jgi:hypothetical protein
MCRLFTMIEGYRYYYAGAHWVQWAHAAKLIPSDQALDLAISLQCDLEEL